MTQNIQEKITNLEHNQKVILKSLEQIKSHLWRQPNKPKSLNQADNRELVRQEAINYINNVVIPEIKAHEIEQGEVGVQGLTDWVIAQLAQPVAEYLKTQAAFYIAEALAELKRKAIPYAVKIADWVLDKLEDVIINQYKSASKEQQEQFKESIEEYFPNSRLLNKIKL